jgi:hypothetical protein
MDSRCVRLGTQGTNVPTVNSFHKGLGIVNGKAASVRLPRRNVIQSLQRHFSESAMQLQGKGAGGIGIRFGCWNRHDGKQLSMQGYVLVLVVRTAVRWMC